jgi:hypothetical protein
MKSKALGPRDNRVGLLGQLFFLTSDDRQIKESKKIIVHSMWFFSRAFSSAPKVLVRNAQKTSQRNTNYEVYPQNNLRNEWFHFKVNFKSHLKGGT